MVFQEFSNERAVMAEKNIKPKEPIAKAFALTLFGPLLWAIHFTALYALHTLLCTADASSEQLTILVASTVLTIGALAMLAGAFVIFRGRARAPASDAREPSRILLNDIAGSLTVVSAAGVLWAGAAASLIDPCSALR